MMTIHEQEELVLLCALYELNRAAKKSEVYTRLRGAPSEKDSLSPLAAAESASIAEMCISAVCRRYPCS